MASGNNPFLVPPSFIQSHSLPVRRRVLVTTNNNTTTLDCTHLSADDHLIVILSRRRRWTRITFYCMLPINLQKHRLRTGGGGQEQGIASNWIASQDECALEPHLTVKTMRHDRHTRGKSEGGDKGR